MGLFDDLAPLRLVDQHAHNLLLWEESLKLPYSAAFTEGCDPTLQAGQARSTLFFQRSLVEMAELLECSPDQVEECRRRLGLEALAARCFEAAALDWLLLDDGLTPSLVHPLAWHQQFVPTRRVARVEWMAEQLLAEATDFDSFRQALRHQLETVEAVGFKSIAAYRGGLELVAPEKDEAEAQFSLVRGTCRLAHRPFLDFVVDQALEVAARRGLPVQFHTGFGDPDLDLARSDPTWLRGAIERHPSTVFVLLHAGYPYHRQAGFLASVYPNVVVDFGLAVPFLSVAGMREVVSGLLELAPVTRLVYSSDASRIPDLFYLGARWGRRMLAEVLEQSISDGDLSALQAESAARAILRENALALYQLEASWSVWRQDDAGNRVLVVEGLTRGAAEQRAAKLEAGGHKQLYWIERQS